MSGLTVDRLEAGVFDRDAPTPAQADWQAYVSAHGSANLYHTLQWRDLIADVFGHAPVFLRARRGERIVGVLPAFRIRFPVLGTKVVSLPYEAGSGGPLADDADVERALLDALVDAARAERARHVELRLLQDAPALRGAGFDVAGSVFHSEVDLSDGEGVWKRVGRDQVGKMRKAARAGVTVRAGTTAADFDAYYQVYLTSFHAFGTPPYAARYYREAHRRLLPGREVQLFLAEHEGRTVGGYLLFRLGSRAVNKIAAVLPSAMSLGVFPALYGHVLDWCVAEGIDWLSYGTSAPDDQGLVGFKERWGASTHTVLRCTVALEGTVTALEDYYDPDTLPKRMWRRLPRALTPPLGHLLNRWFA
ncbi:MAG: GNAT family N-acetyltransferase [Gemmatimonadota bacterium]